MPVLFRFRNKIPILGRLHHFGAKDTTAYRSAKRGEALLLGLRGRGLSGNLENPSPGSRYLFADCRSLLTVKHLLTTEDTEVHRGIPTEEPAVQTIAAMECGVSASAATPSR